MPMSRLSLATQSKWMSAVHGTTGTGNVTDGNDFRSQGVALGVPTARISASIGEKSKYWSARNNYTFSPAKTQDMHWNLKLLSPRPETSLCNSY